MVSEVAKRNLKIKKLLSNVFGKENVKVRGDRGTAYGWVNIYIKIKKHDGECFPPDWRCYKCIEQIDKTKSLVWKIFKENGIDKELSYYIDDFGEKRVECIINVELT